MTRELRAMRRQAIAHLTKGMASSTATSVPQPVLSKDSTENIPPQSVATVDTWDVFDTLIARYCFAPGEVSEIVARRINHPQFLEQRLGAQQELDSIGKPYNIFDIYQRMQENGVDGALSNRLLKEELHVEREQAIPIRRNLERIKRNDILVSDMYLPATIITRCFIKRSYLRFN